MAAEHRSGNPGNFAQDRAKASRAGRLGGQHSSGNFANDRERAAEAGRKGGQASHGSGRAGKSATAQQNAVGGAEHKPGDVAEHRNGKADGG